MFQTTACHRATLLLAAACGSVSLVCASPAQAQSAGNPPTALTPSSAAGRSAPTLAARAATHDTPQSVVTVASRLPLRAEQVTADAVVITRDQLLRLPADNLADALQALAGVQVSRTGGPGQPTSVLIRGAAASNTLVLVDGVRMGSATLGQFDFSTIGLAGIERIEVLRGPGASVYGADAVGGVVLVTTRAGRPGGQADGRAQVRNRLTASAGSNSSTDLSAGTQWAQGAWDAQLQWARQASQGVSAVRPNDRFGLYNPDADGYRRQTLQASGGWQLAPNHRVEASTLQARLFSRYDSAEYAPPTFAPNPLLDFSTRTDTSASALRYEGRAGSVNWRARLGRGVEDSTSGARQLDTYRTERDEAGVQIGWSLARGHDLVAAWDRLDEQVRTNNYTTPGTRSNDAITLAYTGQFGAVQVQADGREDRNSVYGTHRTGRTGLRWALSPDTSVRLLAATTFRAPSFNELYFPGYGVATLAPEEGRSMEAGLSQRTGRLQWQASVWRNQVDNLIAYSADPARCPKTPAYAFGCAANFGEAELKGYTVEAQWPRLLGATVPTWRLAYDGVDARDGNGQTLPRRARHQWRLQSQHTVAGWQLGTAWLWQSERREAGAVLRDGTRLDVQALRALGPALPGWTLRLSVLNALNGDIEPARDYRLPGRQFFAGLRWEGR